MHISLNSSQFKHQLYKNRFTAEMSCFLKINEAESLLFPHSIF